MQIKLFMNYKSWYTVTDISEITVAIDAPTVPRYIISGIFNIKLTIAPMITDTVYDLFWLVGKRYWLPIALLQAIKIIAIDSIINTGITSLNWDVKKWHEFRSNSYQTKHHRNRNCRHKGKTCVHVFLNFTILSMCKGICNTWQHDSTCCSSNSQNQFNYFIRLIKSRSSWQNPMNLTLFYSKPNKFGQQFVG